MLNNIYLSQWIAAWGQSVCVYDCNFRCPLHLKTTFQ